MSNENDIDVVEISRMGMQGMMAAEIDSQIATAKKYPRDIKKFKATCMELATMDRQTAEGCYYALPRGGKTIYGPSVRLAEIAISCFKNIVAQGEVTGSDARNVFAMGMVRDLENNVAVKITTSRKITNKEGKRYNLDMITMTGNAAVSIALRNAIFRVIPTVYINPIFEACMQIAAGDVENFQQAKKKAIEYLGEMGISPERICKSVNRKTVEDITRADLIDLRGFVSAINAGESTIESIFPEAEATEDKLEADEIEPEKQPDKSKTKKKAKKAKKTKTKSGEHNIFS